MKRIAILAFLISFIIAPLTYAAEVKNATTKQVGNRMLFEYVLDGDEDEAEVRFSITIKGQSIPRHKLQLEGDFGRVKPGKGKKIWWNMPQDSPKEMAGDVQ